MLPALYVVVPAHTGSRERKVAGSTITGEFNAIDVKLTDKDAPWLHGAIHPSWKRGLRARRALSRSELRATF